MLDVNAAKKRFNTLNRARLNRLLDGLRGRQRDVMEIMVLLFHTNHPTFPGFVSKNTPVGVSDYSPSNRALETSKKLVRSFEFKRRALPQYDIHSIFVMGSGGTIAYTDGSDFDIWICHRQGLSESAKEELQKKATAIEKWAASFNLEVHFFLMDAEVFKQGTEVDLSVESSGTVQHYLLLDEFYRTGILMAGRYPIWWLVPPKEEKEYEKFVQQLKKKRFVKENESIDFGGFPHAPVSEFFGAALWQLYKSVDSPYKAVLKLMLMEVYAEDYPDVEMLSMSYKKSVYNNSTEMSKLDPYVMLYKRIEEYLKEKKIHPTTIRTKSPKKLEGKKSSVKVLSDDIAKDLDNSLKKMSKNSTKASEAIQNPKQLSEMFSNFILATDDIVKKQNIVFPGFSKKSLTSFRNAMKKLGVNENSIDDLVTDAFNFRTTAAVLKNTINKNKNVNVATKELNDILNNRVTYN